MERAAQAVVEKVLQADDAKARLIEAIDPVQPAFQGMCTLDAEHGTHRAHARLPTAQQLAEFAAAGDYLELFGRAGRRVVELVGLKEGALVEAGPGPGWPGLCQCQQGDGIQPLAAVAVVTLAGGGARHRTENLNRDVALAQARHIDVTAITADQQVAVPQGGIRVQVADHQALVQNLGLWAHRPGLVRNGEIQAVLDPARQPQSGDCREQDKARQNQNKTTLHRVSGALRSGQQRLHQCYAGDHSKNNKRGNKHVPIRHSGSLPPVGGL